MRRFKCHPLSARVTFFDYENIIWNDRRNASLMSELQVLQNKATRHILDYPKHSSATEAIKRLEWEPLVRRSLEHHAVYICKLIK